MKWSTEAEEAVKKVPFFVRKRVRARVEQEARQAGRHAVGLADVKATQKRYLTNMAAEVKGYQLDTCFGPGGCPNRTVTSDGLLARIEALLEAEGLLEFLKKTVKGELKFHHELRVTLADCPNACSQPQIKDIAVIGACAPRVTDVACSSCEACCDACQEDAIELVGDGGPRVAFERCLACGKCAVVCPTGTLVDGARGYRVLLGGKLGRHPRLAREIPGIFSEDEVLEIIRRCLAYYKSHSTNGERFADLLTPEAFDHLTAPFRK